MGDIVMHQQIIGVFLVLMDKNQTQQKVVAHHVEVENIAIQVVGTYALHVQLAKNQTQQKVVAHHVKTENIVIPKVGMYVQHAVLDMN
jgi:hypothetical protein